MMNYLYYDGECPFCQKYVTLVRVRQSIDKLNVVNARDDESLVQKFKSEGFDLNEGMLLILDGKYYYGPDCVLMLSLLSTQKNLFNRINGWLFGSKSRAKFFYPIMVFGRKIVLSILGVKPIQ